MSRHGKRAAGKALLSAIVSAEDKEALRALAKADGRTLSNYVAHQLARIAKARGIAPPAQPEKKDADLELLDRLQNLARQPRSYAKR